MDEEQFIRNIGQNVKRIRLEKKMTQETLAHMLDMDDGSLRRIESGRTNPTAKTLFRIAKALDVGVEDLIKFCN